MLRPLQNTGRGDRNQGSSFCTKHKNRSKIALQALCARLCNQNGHEKSILALGDLSRLDFGRVWVPPTPLLVASWPLLSDFWSLWGASWAHLGRILGALWHLLAAKWCLRHARARFLIDFGLISPPFCVSSEGMFCMLSSALRTSLHNVFMDAVTTLLHLLALFLLPFWCGGLCTAHGIDDAD